MGRFARPIACMALDREAGLFKFVTFSISINMEATDLSKYFYPNAD